MQHDLDCIRLNLRILRLALRGDVFSHREVADSYDRLAAGYETNWLTYIQPATDHLLARINDLPAGGGIVDLGCGTGYTTNILRARFPKSQIIAIDISPGMLEIARQCVGETNVRFVQAEMLAALRDIETGSQALVVSAWAMGYSRSAAVIREVYRILQPGGRFAFIVNLADTLHAINFAFRRTMQAHPEALRYLAWPRFPRSAEVLGRAARSTGFQIAQLETGYQSICMQEELPQPVLPWLLQTGVLAGFDAMLPLSDNGPVAQCFEAELRATGEDLRHHFAEGVLLHP